MSVFCDEVEPRFVWRKNAGSLFTPRLPPIASTAMPPRPGNPASLRCAHYLDIKQLEEVVRSSPISTANGGSNV